MFLNASELHITSGHLALLLHTLLSHRGSLCSLVLFVLVKFLSTVYIQTVPDLQWFDLWSFNFVIVWKQYTSRRNPISNFEFGSFPRLATCSMILSQGWAEQQAIGPGQPHDHQGQLLHRQPFCAHTTILTSVPQSIIWESQHCVIKDGVHHDQHL